MKHQQPDKSRVSIAIHDNRRQLSFLRSRQNMKKNIVQLSNGWSAEFENQGEFRMSTEGWNMSLNGPDHKRIRYFEKEIVLVNDFEGKQAQSCIQLSEDGRHGYLTTGLEFGWVIDFTRNLFAPHRVYISHHQGEKYLQAYEQPAFKGTQEYVRISGKLIYITFPFYNDEKFPRVWIEYLEVRKRQLDELYFRP